MEPVKRISLCFLILVTNAALGQTAGMLSFQGLIKDAGGGFDFTWHTIF